MGADFLVAVLYTHKDKEPDWEAGLKALEGLEEDEEENPVPTAKDIEDLKNAFHNSYRDAALVRIREYDVVLSGGMSWGDDPTDTFGIIVRILNYPKVWQAMGFLD